MSAPPTAARPGPALPVSLVRSEPLRRAIFRLSGLTGRPRLQLAAELLSLLLDAALELQTAELEIKVACGLTTLPPDAPPRGKVRT